MTIDPLVGWEVKEFWPTDGFISKVLLGILLSQKLTPLDATNRMWRSGKTLRQKAV